MGKSCKKILSKWPWLFLIVGIEFLLSGCGMSSNISDADSSQLLLTQ